MSTDVLIRASDVRKSFEGREILKGVSVDVHQGEVMCILGPSGAGKSTFLRCINHMETIDSGSITVDGEQIGYRTVGGRRHEAKASLTARQRRKVGMVFQRFNLFHHMTVLENIVEAPVRVLGVPRQQAEREALVLLERVGLADKRGAYPEQLSGGQQQRIAIARALAMRPEVMLFDEPTSALDPELVGDVLAVMKDLGSEGMTMVVVTHEIGFAREVADTVLFMVDGAVGEHGPARQVLDNPTTDRFTSFLEAVL